MLLYHYAGAYADLDIGCRKPLSVVLGVDTPAAAGVVFRTTQPIGVATDFIAVRRPHDPVIRGVLSGLRRAARSWWYLPLPYTTVMFRRSVVAPAPASTRLFHCSIAGS